jgi:hypothetical protein
MELKIVIPSHKRAGKVLTKSVVPSAIICVEKSQEQEYKMKNPDQEIVTHPDSVIGLLAKRNWIYRKFGSVFMLDDDIAEFRRLYIPQEESNAKANRVDEKTTLEIIRETAYCAKDAGAYMFGFNTVFNPMLYKAQNPIELTGFVNGCAMGVLEGSNLYWNENIRCNCDYWISLLNAFHHRLIFKDVRFSFVQKDTFTGAGGQAEFRNIEQEQADFQILQRYFGRETVVLKKDSKISKLKHQFQKSMKLPF